MIIPMIRVEYVNITSITSKHQDHINIMKQLYGHHDPVGTQFMPGDEALKGLEHRLPHGSDYVVVPSLKYTLDLFYLAPLYHLELVQIDKLVVLDVDLQFRVDMIELFKHFDNFADDEMIGVANDLTPHYFDHAQDFIKKNPGTRIGSPGRFQ